MAVKFSGSSTPKSQVQDANYICMCSDGKSVSVNPSHLSLFSGYFSSLLHSEMKETRTKSISLKLIHSDVLQLIVNLLAKCQKHQEDGIQHLERSQTSISTLTKILDAADYLDIPVMKEVCDEYLCRKKSVSSANFEELLELNHKYSLTRLGQAIINFMSGQVTDLCATDRWLVHLSSTLLEDLLASDNTKVSTSVLMWWKMGIERLTCSNGYSACLLVGLLVGCLTSQQHASVSHGRICSDNSACCHTEMEAAGQTSYLTQSEYTDTGPTFPSADPVMPDTWQGSHWSANF